MRTSVVAIVLLLVLGTGTSSEADAHEFSGYVTVEGWAFINDPLNFEQDRDNASIAIQPEYYHEWKNGSSFTFTSFVRLDSADRERSHFDIRELNYLGIADNWELRIGIGKVFWGVTESQHLVDIINQTDLVESIDGEDKLGQPMIHLSIPRNWGVTELFTLPYFRERTFPGHRGRLRTQLVVDTDRTVYESSAEERHVDAALRYSHTIGDWDFGLYHFYGTNREPTLIVGQDNDGKPILIPRYEIIHQTGMDLQLVAGQWLWKWESIYRSGQDDDDFFAFTGGFEYTFTAVTTARMDIGVLSEWLYDERGKETTTPYDNDIMVGTRLALNDAASTEALIAIVQDMDNAGRIFSLESSRRIGDRWKISLEVYLFVDSSEDDVIHALRDDDNVRIEFSYFF